MMAKIGKFSTGFKGSAKRSPSPYGQSNKGWESRSSLTGQMHGKKTVKMAKGGTATGKDVPVYSKK